jgi:hypothetical protein
MYPVTRYLGATTLAVVLLGAAQASATPVVLFDSITASTPNLADTDIIDSSGPLYASFSTGASAVTLTQIVVGLAGGVAGIPEAMP